jgi:hypothetical protein
MVVVCDLEEGSVCVDVVLRAMLGQPALAVLYEGVVMRSRGGL